MSTDYKTDYSHDKNINTLDRGSYNDFGDGTPAKQILANSEQLHAALTLTDPKLDIVPIPVAGDKYSYTFREGTKKLILNTGQKLASIFYNWNEADYDNNILHSVDEGSYYEAIGTDLVGKTIYFTSDTDGVNIEIEEWI